VALWISSPLGEGVEQALVPGQVGHDAQLDLGVVRRHQLVAGFGHEGLADAPPFGAADGDVLQVGVGRRQPAGGGHGLVVGGVDAPVLVDHQRQLVGIGGLELA
jgi:hypothetical protein